MYAELGLGALRDLADGIRHCVALGRAKALAAEAEAVAAAAAVAGTVPPQGVLPRTGVDALRCLGVSSVGCGDLDESDPSLARLAGSVVDAMCRKLEALAAAG